jgi:hypothetical protein
MKHAGGKALEGLGGLLAVIRKQPGLVERSPGVFYRKGRAFLHFHEDPAGLFADLRSGADWERFRVETAAEKRSLLMRLGSALPQG